MKFDDELLLNINGAAAGGLAVGMLGTPKVFNDLLMTTPVPAPMMHHGALMAGGIAASEFIVAKADGATKKKMLKMSGVAWMACAATHMINVQRGGQKRDGSVAVAAGSAALGAVSLWAGFKE